jgi:signal transduction histidine kinase
LGDFMDHALTEIYSHLTHELKRPLASLQQSVYLLLDEASGPLTPEQRRIVEIQLRNAKRVNKCITDLGYLAQIEAGTTTYQLANHSLATLIEEVVSEFEDSLSERGVRIEAEFPAAPLEVRCDKALIGRAIGHVVENATKFSPTAGLVRIGVQQTLQLPSQCADIKLRKSPGFLLNQEGYCVISVADSGPGIAPSEREAIFQRFYQVKEHGNAYQQGLGIGLTLSKSIVQDHGGAVWVDANPGGGSLVSILLPVATKMKVAQLEAFAKST